MKNLLLLLFVPFFAMGAEIPPTPFPVFLRYGFSSILEFAEAPTKVVLGDTQNFQVEKLDQSLVLKTLTSYAVTNMFVYFRREPTRLFVLNASEDAEPTYYKKFETLIIKKSSEPVKLAVSYSKGGRVDRILFDEKKDYLTVDVRLTTDSLSPIKPNWDLVRMLTTHSSIKPTSLWAERKEIQKNSSIKARFIFTKPNVSKNLKGVSITIPVQGSALPIRISLGSLK